MIRRGIILLLLLMLVSCAPVAGDQAVVPTAALAQTAQAALLSEQAAIERALLIASQSRPEISGSEGEPTNMRAEQTTLAVAAEQITGGSDVGAGNDPNMVVWLVTMDGIWRDEFPRTPDLPTPEASPEPYRHYVVILNARTGEEIMSSIRP